MVTCLLHTVAICCTLFTTTLQVSAQPTRLWATPYGGSFSAWDRSGTVLALVGSGGTMILDVATGDTMELPGVGGEGVAFGQDSSAFFYRDGRAVVKVWLTEPRAQEYLVFHDTNGYSFGLTPDGRTGYISFVDGTVVLFETATGNEIMRLNRPNMGRVVFDASGTHFALLSRSAPFSSSPAYIYNLTSNEPIATLGDNEVHCAFPPQPDVVLTTSQNGKLTLWQISTGRSLKRIYWSLDVAGDVTALHCTTDSTVLLVAGGSSGATTLNTYTVPGLASIAQYSGILDAVGTSGNAIGATDPDGFCRFLTPDSLLDISGLDPTWGYAEHVALSPDGTLGAVACSDNATRLISIESGDQVQIFHPQRVFLQSTFLPAPYSVISLYDRVEVKDFVSGENVGTIGRAAGGRVQVLSRSRLVELSPDMVRLFTLPEAATVAEYPMSIGVDAQSVNVSPDGRYGVASTLARGFIVWELETGDTVVVGDSKRPTYGPYAIDESSQICAAVLTGDSLVDVYSMSTGERLWSFDDLNTFAVFGLAIVHEEGQARYLVATCGGPDPHGVVWDLTTGETLHRLDGHEILAGTALALNNTQRVVTRGNDSTLRIWNVRTGEQEVLYEFDGYPCSFEILGNEEALVAVLDNGDGMMLSLNTADTLATFHTLHVPFQIAVNEDRSKIMLGTTGYGRVEAWDLSSLLPVSVEETQGSPNSQSSGRSNIVVRPHPASSQGIIEVSFANPHNQMLSLYDALGRLISRQPGSGTLGPQTFSLGVVSPLTEFIVIKAECDGDVVMKGAVVAGE